MKKIIINSENSRQRIDKFLVAGIFLNEEISRGEIIKLIKSDKILVNNKSVKPSYVLKENDELYVEEIKKNKKIIPNSKIKFKIVFENKDFIIVDKSVGVKVHPGNFEEIDTLVNGLVYNFPEIENIGDDLLRPGIVHRLDKDTSGLLIVAKNQKSFETFKEKFKNREIQKIYEALIHGHLENKKGIIEKPIARASSYKKQIIAGKKTKTKIRSAVTEYKVLKSLDNFDLVEVKPKTGRMHQIRVHLFSIGHPIVGDEKYKLKKFKNPENIKKHLLHAKEVSFELFGKKYEFFSEPERILNWKEK